MTYLIINIDLFVIFSEFNELPSNVDWNFISKQKDKEVETLKTKLKELKQKHKELEELKKKPKFPPNTEKTKQLKQDFFDAIKKGDLSSVQWFIEKEGVNVEQRYYDMTPLMYASFNSDEHPDECLSIVEYLIEKGANVNSTKTSKGCTALHYARTLEVAKALVEHGANIDACDLDGETPLIYHSSKGRVDIVKYLLSVGANKEAKNDFGETAYDVACNRYWEDDKKQRKKEIRKLLKEDNCKI